MEIKDKDGNILICDEVKEGVNISVKTEDGETPTPTGNYILEDESEIEITDGVITKVTKPVEQAEQTPAENPDTKRIDELERKIAELEKLLGTTLSKQEFSKETSKFETFSNKLVEIEKNFNEKLEKFNSFSENLTKLEKEVEVIGKQPQIKQTALKAEHTQLSQVDLIKDKIRNK